MKPLKVKVDLMTSRGGWIARAQFTGSTAVAVKGNGATVPEALRELASAIELCFEHLSEAADA